MSNNCEVDWKLSSLTESRGVVCNLNIMVWLYSFLSSSFCWISRSSYSNLTNFLSCSGTFSKTKFYTMSNRWVLVCSRCSNLATFLSIFKSKAYKSSRGDYLPEFNKLLKAEFCLWGIVWRSWLGSWSSLSLRLGWFARWNILFFI